MYFRIIHSVCLILALVVQLIGNPEITYGQVKKKRPRIGLVLGGGGARGAAHIGILKVLEEQHIPIDYVVGTSMGAIVGGAYAAGLSPEEIERVLTTIDWKDLFVDDAPRAEQSFRHKKDERRFTGVEVGIRDGKLLAPRGAFAGRKLEFLLQKVLHHTAGTETFDQLDIPFRAIATNIETGDPVILSSGSLALAIRASMSIPGAFSPVEINGHLVDGYVSNNVPVNVAQALGADVIIAVDVGTPLAKRDDLNTLLDIVNQVGGIATIKNVEEQLHLLNKGDVLIRPDLGIHATTDFEHISEIIPLGRIAAEKSVAELIKYSVSKEEYQTFIQRQRKQPESPIEIDFVKITPTKRVSTERIEAEVTIKPGTTLDFAELNKTLTRIQSIGEFEQTSFSLLEENGQRGLELTAREKSWGPNYFRFGLNLASDFEEDNYFNFLIDFRIATINRLGGEWDNQLQIGRTTRAFTEFYQPLDYSNHFFIAPSAEIRQDLRDIYQDGTHLAEYRTRKYGAGADIGYNFGTVAELRAGLWSGHSKSDPSTGSAELPEFDIDRGGARFRFTYDQTDDANFPRRGGYFQADEWLERTAFGGEESYEKTDFTAAYPVSFGPHTLLPRVSMGIDFNDNIPFYDRFLLGGPATLSGFRTDELYGNQMALGKLMYYYQLSESLFSFARAAYLGASLDLGNTWQSYDDISANDLIFGGSIFYGADTLMGPLYVGYGLNEEARSGEFFLMLGQRL